jgi:hypothetical protein
MPLTALSLTPSARTWLTTTTSARVLNSFERACNLINQNNDVLTLVTSERGLTPFAIVVASAERDPFQLVTTEDSVWAESEHLQVGGLEIDFKTVTMWNPAPDWPMLRRMFANNPVRVRELAALVLEIATPASLLDLYRIGQLDRTGLDHAMLVRALEGAGEVVGGLKRGDDALAKQGASKLAGLGIGLTPAGDDFMVGIALAVWAGLYNKEQTERVRLMVETACPLTTVLSAAYLRSAANGECIAAWHTLFAALLLSDSEVTRMAAKSLMLVGHSSGSDGLAGFLAGHFLQTD